MTGGGTGGINAGDVELRDWTLDRLWCDLFRRRLLWLDILLGFDVRIRCGDGASCRGFRRGAWDLRLQHARAHNKRRDGKWCVSHGAPTRPVVTGSFSDTCAT